MSEISAVEAAVQRVLNGVLGKKSLSFSEFRFGMINECEEFLTDQQIHDLFQQYVSIPTKGDYDVFEERAVEQAMAYTERQEQIRAEAERQAAIRREQRSKQIARRQQPKRGKKKQRGRKKDWRDVTLGEVANKVNVRVNKTFGRRA